MRLNARQTERAFLRKLKKASGAFTTATGAMNRIEEVTQTSYIISKYPNHLFLE
ncbi:hypothetical protein G3A_06285 [Bacillus sp. 17376]|uniref:Uncharacterized protein n=1 Tax=Mesobacillus boroniphilus JCM 21738 TaxID=1294265 RepID=W4RTA9_9BACI|nr:hypothetical protein G3A_06285 [Bacillus sp. 17376]GAE47342.1 hypothetical protein JCM21738_4314 [Mesobacillus boroniphilus JCM 21738]